MNKIPVIDFHTHPTLKPFNSSLETERRRSIWMNIDERHACTDLGCVMQKSIKDTEKDSQTNFLKLPEGNVRGIFVAMGPAERNFFKPHIKNPLLRLVLPKIKDRAMAECVTGFCTEKVNKIFERIEAKSGIDYFRGELVPELQYLLSEQEKSSDNPQKFCIAKNFAEFSHILSSKPDTVAVILTVEGGHSFGNYASDNDFSLPFDQINSPDNLNRFRKIFKENITHVKKHWGENGAYAPFFVTLCHHFWNLLSGHSKSMAPSQSFFKPGMDAIIDQTCEMNSPLTMLGEEVIHMLLDRTEGRRILIDTKHMSLPARKQYFEIVESYRAKGDRVPVICSHTSVNLFETMDDSVREADTYAKDKDAYLSRFSINLSNEEIKRILDSDGLIGIILNEGRVAGGKAKEEIKNARHDPEKLRAVYVRIIMSNVLQIIKAGNSVQAWDAICIGSDFDGIIDPYETYRNECYMQDLAMDMLAFLQNPSDLTAIGLSSEQVKSLMFGCTAESLTEKIMHRNVMLFLEKYFHDDYLRGNA